MNKKYSLFELAEEIIKFISRWCKIFKLLSGVPIGDGALIGAGLIITEHVGTGEIVAGNPAERVNAKPEFFNKGQA
ncbi:MAG: hypothetical protein EHM85_07705 [Desulfobacteraceae bacterium]|nr:MAG: hypothetical protein EHM85_07705 [Desulfobacteraceae bacterium]